MPLNIKDLAISSPDVEALTTIADAYVADGGNALPTLSITGVPADAVELAVIVHDPDAPLPQGFTHATLYGIEARDQVLAADGYRFGPNGGGAASYFGPQPPSGHGRHHYYFWVFALSAAVEGEPTREEFLERYADKVIEQNRFVAHYEL